MPQPSRVGLTLKALLCAAAICSAPDAAQAHSAFKSLGGFWSGALHVLTSFDQILLLLALAILASLQRRRRDAAMVGAVFLGASLGSFVSWAGGAQFDTLISISATMILVGAAGAAAANSGKALLICGAACCGAEIGFASQMGAETLQPALFALGAAIAAAAATSYVLIGAAPSCPDWVKIALRAGASWIAAIGLMVFALEVSRLRGHA